MKRIYMTLGLIAALGTASYAQVADLAAIVEVDSAACLDAGQMLDTVQNGPNPYGIWGLQNNGPDAITNGSTVLFLDPSCKKTATGFSVTGSVLQADAQAGDYIGVRSFLPVDSIFTLLDYDSLAAPNASLGSVLISNEDLIEGHTYGFYVYVLGVGDDPNNPENTDTVLGNNLNAVPVVWHCNTGIQDMMEEAAQNITIFPNPVQNNELHFRYGFIKATEKATARVVDMTGRVLKSQELGKNNFGTQEFTMDISALPAGNYMLEISTGYINAVGKFTVTK